MRHPLCVLRQLVFTAPWIAFPLSKGLLFGFTAARLWHLASKFFDSVSELTDFTLMKPRPGYFLSPLLK